MSLWNPYAFTPTGQPVAPVAPPALRVIGGPATAQQMKMAQHAFAQFCMNSRLSSVPNPVEDWRLTDGTPYKIIDVAGVRTMMMWPTQANIKPFSGIVFEVLGGTRWLLLNTPTESGDASEKWEFKNITRAYPLSTPNRINELESNASAFRLTSGKWKYAYSRRFGFGQYGHVDTYGTYGHVVGATPSGRLVSVSFSPYSKYFTQELSTKTLAQLPAPPYGTTTPGQVAQQSIASTLSSVLIDADGLYLPDRETYPVSPNGRYMGVLIDRSTGRTDTYLDGLLYAPDIYRVKVALWPETRYSVSPAINQINLNELEFSLSSTPAEFDATETAIKVFEITDTGFVATSEKVIGVTESVCTPSYGRLISSGPLSGNIGASRFGVQVSDQYWPTPIRITGYTITPSGSSYDLVDYYVSRSETYGFRVTKELLVKTEHLEGIASDGEPIIYEDTEDNSYVFDYSRPTTTSAHTRDLIPSGATHPVIGVDVASGGAVYFSSSGTFSSVIDSTNKYTRKYSDIEIDLEKTVVHIEHTGDFLEEVLTPGSSLIEPVSFNSVTQYTSECEQRSILFRDPHKLITVYYETITTLTHLSTVAQVYGDITYTPSTEIPVTTAKVWIICKDQSVSVDVPLAAVGNRFGGYVNVGRATSEMGEDIYTSGPFLNPKDPIGGRIGYAPPESDFLYSGSGVTLAQAITGHAPMQFAHAMCPETGGLLIEFSGRRFLIDDVEGIRDADTALTWPPGLAGKQFFTF